MSATTFTTQKQLMSKNMPADAMNNPFAQQQKILLYVFPLVFAVSGVNFPIGVLLYWLTTNIWSMGQQFYVIRRNPTPGSPAAEALERREAAKAARGIHGHATADGRRERPSAGRRGGRPDDASPTAPPSSPAQPRPGGQRQQPKRNHEARPKQQPLTPDRRLAGRSARAEPDLRPRPPEDTAMTESPEDQPITESAAGEAAVDRRRTESTRDRAVEPADAGRRDRPLRPSGTGRAPPGRRPDLEKESEIAADYLEDLLDIADLDGDIDMDVERDRALVSVVGGDLDDLVGRDGVVLEALQELTRLAVLTQTGERSRLMLDIGGLPGRPPGGAHRAGPADGRDGQGHRRAGPAGADDARSSARSCTTRSRRPD